MQDKIKELTTAFAKVSDKIQEMKANGEDKSEYNKFIIEDLIYMTRNLSERISYVADAMYEYQYQHSKGHPLPLKTASQMKAYLKACEMSDDYNVEKPTIYVSASARKGLQITACYSKK